MTAPMDWHDVSMSGGIALGQHHPSAELTKRVRRKALVMVPRMLLETP